MSLDFRNNDAFRSLDRQQLLDWLRGWQVVDPDGGSNLVTEGSGDFEYDVASGDVNLGGSVETATQQSVDFTGDVDASADKLAVIYRDANGDAATAVSDGGTREPAADDVRSTHAPPPPSLHDVDGTVLAEVLIPSGASGIGSEELRDRRLPATLTVADAVSLSTLTAPGDQSPSQTGEGELVWDTDDDKLTAGDGSARKTFVNEERSLTGGNAVDPIGDLSTDRTIDVDEGAIDIGNLAGVLADAVIKSAGDDLAWGTNGDDDLILENTDDGTTLLTWDQDTGDITFDQLGGSPSFGGHDHTESGLAVIPNAGLANASISLTGGNAMAAIGSIALGGSATVAVATDGIQTDELDLSITPTWTGEHTFNAGITGLPSPTDAGDAARKAYVDAVEQALDIKDSVQAATDGANVDLGSASDPNPIDGVTLADGDRVLLKDQTDATENGIYDSVTATDPTTWTRSADADEDAEVTAGLFTFVEAGTVNNNRGFVLTTNDPITVGTTALTFTQFSGAGQITAGDGLTKTADTLNIAPADFVGALLSVDGNGDIQVDEGDIDHDAIDQSTVSPDDHHPRGGYTRTDVTSQTVTLSAWDAAWVDTAAAGGAVTATLPADADVSDGDRVEVGVEDASNDTDVAVNAGQSIIGPNPTLTQAGDTVTYEYKSDTSTWMVR